MALEKALVVDDKEKSLKVWSDYLKMACGCKQVDTASSVDEVKSLVRQDNLYDLYLVDSLRINPEEEGGWKPTAEHIRAIHSEARIIVNTVYLDDVLKERVTQFGLKIFKKGKDVMDYLTSLN